MLMMLMIEIKIKNYDDKEYVQESFPKLWERKK